MGRVKKVLGVLLAALLLVILSFGIYFRVAVVIDPPEPESLEALDFLRHERDTNFYTSENNWLRKSKSGLWEMYLEGEAFERGAVKGILAREMIYTQEKAFLEQIQTMIPSVFYLHFLKYFIAWFNRGLDEHITEEYQLEIYGVSHAASDRFSHAGPAYLRFLNYHAAHDIGHAVHNMGMVGCTSFAAWDTSSHDSLMIIGRNFDFYVGEAFAREKIVAFMNPEKGHKFMFVTWAGMIGVVSGMNEKGLTVTINAASSAIPLGAKTPVSLLAREILQYAQNIEEALQIAEQRETFVAETFLIGSALDRKAILIEKSSEKMDVFSVGGDLLVCANHFQSEAFENETLNIENIRTSSSPYRHQRVEELLSQKQPINHLKAAAILRDQKGLGGEDIGMGNEKAINQLIAHHSIIFKPDELLVWVSTQPYQLGEYIAYDLKQVFSLEGFPDHQTGIHQEFLTIPPDPFLFSEEYKQFKAYRDLSRQIISETACKNCTPLDEDFIGSFIETNPAYYRTYELVGDYFKSRKRFEKALFYFTTALEKEVTSLSDVERIQQKRLQCQNRK